MPGENIQDWSTTAANNGTADSSINWAEGQARASVNNSARSMMAAIAKDRNLHNGSIITTGSANAQAFISGIGETSVPTGMVVTLKIGAGLNNTATTTLDMNSLGAVVIKDQLGVDLVGTELREGTYANLVYNGTNWILLANFQAAIDTSPTNVRVFTASDTYPTVTNGNVKVMCYCKGGGGGGASSNDQQRSGGGGGEGAESWKLTTAADLSGLAVTVGAGGGSSVYAGSGNAGAASSIAAIVTATGGGGGSPGHLGGTGGAGGVGGTSDWGMPGVPGGTGASYIQSVSGFLGNGGGKGGGVGGAGVGNSGGGGSGTNGAGGSGGNGGGSGIVVCTEYGTI